LCGSAFAQTLELRVVTTGGASSVTDAEANDVIPVIIEGRLTGTATGGLALWGADLSNTGPFVVDLADQGLFLVEAPAGDMEQFDRNLGVTNPPGPDGMGNPTGYSGTDDGANGLLQLGGGTNTINNTGPTVYPVGSVPTGVGNSGFTPLASGDITLPAGYDGSDIVLELANGFANTLDPGQPGPVYNVSAATVSIVGELLIQGGQCPGFGQGATCENCDINGSGGTDGLDIGIIRNSANFGRCTGLVPSCCSGGDCGNDILAVDPCADANGDGVVSGLDLGACRSSACFGS
jgi:hypothetical protein